MSIVVGAIGAYYEEPGFWDADHTLTTADQQVAVVTCHEAGVPAGVAYNANALSSILALGKITVRGLLTRYTVANGVVDVAPGGSRGIAVSYPITGLRTLTPFDAGSSEGASGASWSLTVNGKPGMLAVVGAYDDGNRQIGIYVGAVSALDYTTTIGSVRGFAIGHWIMTANTVQFDMSMSGIQNHATYGVALQHMPGGGGGLILAAERWRGFLRDLRAGLVPPDELRRRYRGLVAI